MISSLLAWLSSLIIGLITSTGYFGVTFLMALESACLPIPSEVIMPFSGFLAAEGKFSFWLVVLMGGIGNLLGSVAAYWMGYWAGRPVIEKIGRYALLSVEDLDLAERWFKKYGQATVFFSRLLPVVRTFISLPAGMAKMDFKKFCLYTLAGSLPWSWALAYLGLKTGENWDFLKVYFHRFDTIIGILIIAAAVWWIWRHFKNIKKNKTT